MLWRPSGQDSPEDESSSALLFARSLELGGTARHVSLGAWATARPLSPKEHNTTASLVSGDTSKLSERKLHAHCVCQIRAGVIIVIEGKNERDPIPLVSQPAFLLQPLVLRISYLHPRQQCA